MSPQPSFTDREVQKRAAAAARGVSARVRYIIDSEEQGRVAQAARRLGVSQRGLQKVYRGVTRDPHASLLVRLAALYHVDLSWLLTGVESDGDEYLERQAARVATQMLHRMVASVGLDMTTEPSRAMPRPAQPSRKPRQKRRTAEESPYATTPVGLADMPELR